MHLSKNGLLILGTALLIGIAFMVYFLVYVKNEERTLHANSFRVLQQIKENISVLEKGFYKNAETIYKQGYSSIVNQNIKVHEYDSVIDIKSLTNCYSNNKELLYCDDNIFLVFEPKDSVAYSISYNNFFNNDLLKRTDVFDYIIISKMDENLKRRKILYTNALGGVADSLFHQENLVSNLELSVATNKYISYNQEFQEGIYVSGLINKENFDRQKRGVSLYLLIISSVILILIIFNMPMIKLRIMSNNERLYAYDVVLTGLTIIVGSALLLLLLFSAVIHFGPERSYSHDQLQALSIKVEDEFKLEMSRAINQLKKIDTLYPIGKFASFKDTVTKDSSSIKIKLSISLNSIDAFESQEIPESKRKNYVVDGFKMYKNVLERDVFGIFNYYKHFNYIFWNDGSARSLVFLSPYINPSYVQDLSHRKYITNIINDTPVTFTDSINLFNIPIGFESIKSVNDGSYEVGIGISTGDSIFPVLAMSTKLVSMMDPVLPNGFGFCLLDESGNTVFHSDIQKNMNENFLQETMDEFIPAIISNTEQTKTVVYGNKKYVIYFSPLSYLSDHYLAIFTTQEFSSTPYALAMNNSILLFVAYLIILFLIYMFFYLILVKSNKLNQSGFIFNWLRPIETDYHFVKYKKIVALNSLVILFLFISTPIIWKDNDLVINNLLLMTIIPLIGAYYAMTYSLPLQKRLNTQLSDNSIPIGRIELIFIIIGSLLSFLLIYNRLSTIEKHFLPGNIIITLLNIILLWAYVSVIFNTVKDSRNERQKSDIDYSQTTTKNVQLAYQKYMLTWVILFSIIPMIIFFGLAFDKEQSIITKYNLSQTYKNYHYWDKDIDIEFKNNFKKDDFEMFKNSMKQNEGYLLFPDFIHLNNANRKDGCPVQTNSIVFDFIYSIIRPYYNEITFLSSGFVKDQPSDSEWQVVKEKDTAKGKSSIGRKMQYKVDDRIIHSNMPGFKTFYYNHWIILTLIIISVIYVYYKVIQFATQRIYGFEYKPFADVCLKMVQESPVNLIKDVFVLNNNTESKSPVNHVFCVSLDELKLQSLQSTIHDNTSIIFNFDLYDIGKNKLEFKDEDYTIVFNKNGDFLCVDGPRKIFRKTWKDLNDFTANQNQAIVVCIEHFEHQFRNTEINKVKYEVLNFLASHQYVKLVISSSVNALSMLDFYNTSIYDVEGLLEKKDENLNNRILSKNLDDLVTDRAKWELLLGKFTEIVLPLKKVKKFPNTNGGNEKLINEELNNGLYLLQQANLLKRYPGTDSPVYEASKGLLPDDKIIKIDQASNTFYASIWNSLSKEEKYLVFDIAKNKFVNTGNSNGVFSLLNKGVFIYDYSMRSFNESFSNFVLSRVNNDEGMEKEVEIRKKGAWNTTFTILLLIVVSLVIFLSIGQQGYFNDLNSLFTALGAIIGIILRFGGFFGSTAKG